ncbi:MAG: hydrogenase expression/formation protein HypE [Pseudomonadota bacterium]
MARPLFRRKLDLSKGKIELVHGSGGKASAQLFEEVFLPSFRNPALERGDDSADLSLGGRIVVATDGHVVSPLFFPGGDIGYLSVHGTINDVACGGAIPHAITVGFIIEEGFPLADLNRIAASMGAAAREANVAIVAGDTKVVERGNCDGVFITTTGIGTVPDSIENPPRADRPEPGDKILISGPIGEHGVTILAAREDLPLATPSKSDTAPLHRMAQSILHAAPGTKTLRDPTRGGLATAINEICRSSGTGAQLVESAIPIKPPVASACEVLGVDPLYLANEGKLIAIVPANEADAALDAMRAGPHGEGATEIGEIIRDPHGFVQIETALGGKRMVDWLVGDPLPRIC